MTGVAFKFATAFKVVKFFAMRNLDLWAMSAKIADARVASGIAPF
jgi:hypothetical protein